MREESWIYIFLVFFLFSNEINYICNQNLTKVTPLPNTADTTRLQIWLEISSSIIIIGDWFGGDKEDGWADEKANDENGDSRVVNDMC